MTTQSSPLFKGWNLDAVQNDYFTHSFAILDSLKQPVNFSDWNTAKIQLRLNENSNVAFTFSSTGGTIDLSGKSMGSFVISTEQLSVEPGKYLYDLELRTSTKRWSIVTGTITITADITR